MFNLKKAFLSPKGEEVLEAVKTAFTPTNQLVDQIHKEFNTAADKALKEALSIIEGTPIPENTNKVERLKKLGFSRVKEVEEVKAIIQNIRMNKERAEIVQSYKKAYPFYKFIFEDQIKQICEKYGLVYGEISLYKGFVPEKCLEKMEKFSLLEEDIIYSSRYHRSSDWHEISKSMFEEESKNRGRVHGWEYRKGVPLHICAPVKDMDTRGMEIEEGYKLKDIPDPVVIQPVRHGGIILAAWGDEASDPIVANGETFN